MPTNEDGSFSAKMGNYNTFTDMQLRWVIKNGITNYIEK